MDRLAMGHGGRKSLRVSREVIVEERGARWKPRLRASQSERLWCYARTIGRAGKGAAFHLRAPAEQHVYVDT